MLAIAELPYPGPPPTPPDAPPWSVLWQAASRVGLFGVGAVLVFTGGTDVQVTVGGGLMLAAAGVAIAKGLK